MLNKIIQKEKERQSKLLDGVSLESQPGANTEFYFGLQAEQHKQIMISLKEYLEEEFDDWKYVDDVAFSFSTSKMIDIKAEIKELTKMIERYDAYLGADEHE